MCHKASRLQSASVFRFVSGSSKISDRKEYRQEAMSDDHNQQEVMSDDHYATAHDASRFSPATCAPYLSVKGHDHEALENPRSKTAGID